MSEVTTYINNITIAIPNPPSPNEPINACFTVTPDPTPGNPFGPASLPNPTNSYRIGIKTDKWGNVPENLVGVQMVFVFTPASTGSIPFTVTGITPNVDGTLPLYRSSQALPVANGAAVILSIPRFLIPYKTDCDYTVTISYDQKPYTIDPDIGVEVQN